MYAHSFVKFILNSVCFWKDLLPVKYWTLPYYVYTCSVHFALCFLHFVQLLWFVNNVSFCARCTLYKLCELTCLPLPPVLRDRRCSENTPQFRQAADPSAPPFLPLIFVCLFGQRWQSARIPRASSSSPSGKTSLVTDSTSMQRRLARVRKLFCTIS